MSSETEQEQAVAVSTKSRAGQDAGTSAKPRAEPAGSVATRSPQEIAETRPAQLFSPVREVERFFDRLMPHAWMRPLNLDWPAWSGLEESLRNIRAPRLDVIDRDKEILIRVELPGVEKKNVDLSVSDNVLVIKGSVDHETEEKKAGYFRREIAHSNFSRSLELPDGVDAEKVSASLKNGILEIVLPKEESLQRRSVEVK